MCSFSVWGGAVLGRLVETRNWREELDVTYLNAKCKTYIFKFAKKCVMKLGQGFFESLSV